MPPGKNKKTKEPAVEYKTEEQLKREARRQAEERRLMEAARPQKSTRVKKADNFWYHYKPHVLGGAVVLAILAFFVKDVFLNVKNDFLILTVSKGYISQDAGAAFAEGISLLAPDVNKDGKTVVSLDIVQLPRDSVSERFRDPLPESSGDSSVPDFSGSSEMDYASVMKLAAVLAANSDPILLLDEAAYDYMTRSPQELDELGNVVEKQEDVREELAIFYPMPGFGGPNEYAIPIEELARALDIPNAEALSGMSFYLRAWEGDKKNGELFERAKAFLLELSGNP